MTKVTNATASKTPSTASKTHFPRLGAHMSVAGGLENAFTAGIEVGCQCLQIFVKNQRQWQAKPLTDSQISAYKKAQQHTGLTPVVAHASYLLNLASPEKEKRQRSVTAMVDELNRCESLGVDVLVFHPGAHMDGDLDHGIKHIARSLDSVTNKTLGYKTLILLETTAGQGTSIGHRFEHIADIIGRTAIPGRLGVCLDTCHLFAAGYDFRTQEDYEAMINNMDNTFGVCHIHCVHTNDSKKELGSRVDRHEHIGKGKIGNRGFAHFLNDPRFVDIPFILETAKEKDGRGTEMDKVNLKRLRSLIEGGQS